MDAAVGGAPIYMPMGHSSTAGNGGVTSGGPGFRMMSMKQAALRRATAVPASRRANRIFFVALMRLSSGLQNVIQGVNEVSPLKDLLSRPARGVREEVLEVFELAGEPHR